jgi:hypothetical protein
MHGEEEIHATLQMHRKPDAQISRSRTACCAAMNGHCRGTKSQAPLAFGEPRAYVNVLEVHEPAIIDATDLLKRKPAYQHCCAREALHVVFPAVTVDRIPEWVKGRPGHEPMKSECLKKVPTKIGEVPGTHKLDLPCITDQSRPDSSNVRTSTDDIQERRKGAWLQAHIWVYDEEEVALRSHYPLL